MLYLVAANASPPRCAAAGLTALSPRCINPGASAAAPALTLGLPLRRAAAQLTGSILQEHMVLHLHVNGYRRVSRAKKDIKKHGRSTADPSIFIFYMGTAFTTVASQRERPCSKRKATSPGTQGQDLAVVQLKLATTTPLSPWIKSAEERKSPGITRKERKTELWYP